MQRLIHATGYTMPGQSTLGLPRMQQAVPATNQGNQLLPALVQLVVIKNSAQRHNSGGCQKLQ